MHFLESRTGQLFIFVFCGLCSIAGSWSQAPEARSAAATDVAPVAATNRFQFHSDTWINLHHFLYHWARAEEGLGRGRRHVAVPERSSIGQLSGQQREAWNQALAFYRESVADRNHFDDEMLEVKQLLLGLGGDPTASPPDNIDGIAAAMTTAMPVYLDNWWPPHDRANRTWIDSVVPLLTRHEEQFVDLTVRVHQAEWPTERWRVDVSAYANARAGYTANGHVVIYATDPGAQDLYGLEILFHEIQHTRAVGGSARRALRQAFRTAQATQPQNLWHSLIFSTAGAFVVTVAAKEGRPEHTPYWIREGFEDLQGWSTLVPVARAHWLPVVRGEQTREQGYLRLAEIFKARN